MARLRTMKLILTLSVILFTIRFLQGQETLHVKDDSFEFAFITDIHIRYDRDAPEGFQLVTDTINTLNPDFVLTGGDLIYDGLRGNKQHCDSLYLLYLSLIQALNMPVYHCIGNHDLFAVYEESPEDESHPDYKYGMFERYLGSTYYSFDHKGWHFIVLNSLEVTRDKKYKGWVSDLQMEWLEGDLREVDPGTPIVVVTHIPLITTWKFVNGGSGTRSVDNAHEVFELFEGYNLKLVLQGHI